MATVKSLQRQLLSTESKLDKASQRISMYTSRLASALAAATKLLGQEVTEQNYRTLLSAPCYFDALFRISNNQDYLGEAKCAHETLSVQLAELRSALEDMQQQESSKATILETAVSSLSTLLDSFREAWYTKMMGKHLAFHARIQAAVPAHTLKADRLKRIMPVGCISGSYLFAHRRMYSVIKEAYSKEHAWLRQPAAVLSQEAYMSRVDRELSQSWEAGLKLLAEKCIRYDVNFAELEAHSPEMTELGIEVLLNDSKPRVLDVRVIWAAEYSELVAPHTRYIITERRA